MSAELATDPRGSRGRAVAKAVGRRVTLRARCTEALKRMRARMDSMRGVGARAAQRTRAEGRPVKLVWDTHEFRPGINPRSTGQGDVFVAEDVDDYARAVRAVLSDPKRYRAAYHPPGLLEQWTWAAQAAVLDQVYSRPLSGRASSATSPKETA